MASYEDEDFIIRKKKKLRRDKPEGLKLILKVGGNSSTSTPEHYFGNTTAGTSFVEQQEEVSNSPYSTAQYDVFSKAHKKSKKKKKKKEKDYEKRDKKKKHRKEKKKRFREESSLDDVKVNENYVDMGHESTSTSPSHYFCATNEEKKDANNLDSTQKRQKKLEKTALQRLLEQIHQIIEKKDLHQFFAWPVTDQIAPGYSLVISHPMDLNSMKRNIENQSYSSLPEYIEDLQLMCRNAMVYNRPDTIYFKAAKKLLHAALKITSADKLRSSPQMLPLLSELSSEQLCFDLDSSTAPSDDDDVKSNVECEDVTASDLKCRSDGMEEESTNLNAQCKNETMSEDCNPDEILAQAKNAAKKAADRVAQRKPAVEMGFIRQKGDGSTTLAIIVSNDGIDGKTKERPVSLGSLIGKLNHGSGNIQGFREDKRNFVKPIKPLYYGAFGSYAPSYDSTFANLTREESQLLFQTYGDETAVQYAESIINFSKDSDYVTTMVDNLLDIMTGGDHRKTKKILEEKKKIREEEEEKRQKMVVNITTAAAAITTTAAATTTACASVSPNFNGTTSVAIGIKSATVNPLSKYAGSDDAKIEFNQLKSLSEYGIDIGFIDYYEDVLKDEQKLSDKLEQTRSLLERLHQTQYERLSAPLPQHLSQICPASEAEHNLADKVTENLANIIKKMSPSNVAPVTGVRKAMGIVPVPPQHVTSNTCSSQYNFQVPNNSEDLLNSNNFPHEDENTSSNPVTGFDLESELREFLESDSALNSFHLPDDVDDTDKTIEQMLSAHS